jgi:REP element-mobilizing transposase RayT
MLKVLLADRDEENIKNFRTYIKKEFPDIRQKLWKEYFWSKSFCLLTTGGAPIEVIKRYIESQGKERGGGSAC